MTWYQAHAAAEDHAEVWISSERTGDGDIICKGHLEYRSEGGVLLPRGCRPGDDDAIWFVPSDDYPDDEPFEVEEVGGWIDEPGAFG